jgi:hypothetical protein
MIDDYTRIAAGLDEARRQMTLDQEMRRFDEVQRQIALGDQMRRFDEVHTQIAASGVVDHVADLQRRIADSGIVDRFADLQKQIADNDLMKLPHYFSSALGHLNQLVDDDHARWDQIARSFDFVEEAKIELPIMPLRIPNMADQFERVLNTRAERDREIQEQQFQLLASIADAGKKQNETMAGIASLQKLLVEESLENTRIQKVILLIAAISTALALAVVLFK